MLILICTFSGLVVEGETAECGTDRSRSAPKRSLQRDELASILQRLFGRFKELNHLQAGFTVVGRCPVVHDAVKEVVEFDLERFRLLHLWCPHITRAVADQQVIQTLAAPDFHTLVIDLDLLVGLQIVPDEHLVLAADERGPDLHGRQPVHVDVGDDVAREIDRDEPHVGVAVQVASAGRDDRLGPLGNDVVHDRQIVRGQIPDHAHVVLEQPEVHARGIEVVQLAQRAAVDQLANLPHGPAEEEGVIHHDLQVLPFSQLDELLGLLRRGCEGLLDEYVFAVRQRGLRQLVMRPDRRDDRDSVDVRRRQHLRKVRRQVDAGIGLASAPQRGRVLVADGHQFAVVETLKISDDVGSPVAVPDDADLHRVRRLLDRTKLEPGIFPLAQPTGADRSQDRNAIHAHSELRGLGETVLSTRAGLPATMVRGGTSRVTTAPAPTMASSPIVTFARIVAPVPIEAPVLTSVFSTFQSCSVCRPPAVAVARGYISLTNITPWPMKTLSSIVTPSQMNVWLETLQRLPTDAFFWISTNAPIFVSSPISQPYKLMNVESLTSFPSLTSD